MLASAGAVAAGEARVSVAGSSSDAVGIAEDVVFVSETPGDAVGGPQADEDEEVVLLSERPAVAAEPRDRGGAAPQQHEPLDPRTFSLLRTNGLPAACNYATSSLPQIMAGAASADWVLLTAYESNLAWVFHAAPELAAVPRVVLFSSAGDNVEVRKWASLILPGPCRETSTVRGKFLLPGTATHSFARPPLISKLRRRAASFPAHARGLMRRVATHDAPLLCDWGSAHAKMASCPSLWEKR